MAKDPHWIEHAHLKKGAYGHHSAKQISRDIKKGGKIGHRAVVARTLAHLRQSRS
jgi:hypothetical protein